jgi:hypothetical protein
MTRPCRELEEWLGQSPAKLSEAQRLSLEQHLGECADCRALHAMSRAVSEHDAATELSATARERAIARALASPARSEPRRAWLGRALAGVAVAAGLVFAFYASSGEPEGAWLEGAGTRTFAHASVTLSGDARVHFDAQTATLSLSRGALEVEVDPAPHAPFAVETRNFRALVLGTSFHVDAERVTVRHGHVRVMRGARLLADLHAGDRYDVIRAQPPKTAQPPRAVEPPTAAPPLEVASAPRAAPVERAKPATKAATTEPARAKRERLDVPPHELLAQARAALARDALDETKRLLASAESSARSGDDRAEAGTLRAELALRERNQAGAVRAYLAVATRYPELASGENALFAAAQLSPPDAARPLLERYLGRYPQGRFATQARTRLQR